MEKAEFLIIKEQVRVLEEVATIYGGHTIENIIVQLNARLKEARK